MKKIILSFIALFPLIATAGEGTFHHFPNQAIRINKFVPHIELAPAMEDHQNMCEFCLSCAEAYENVAGCENRCKNLFADCLSTDDFDSCYKKDKDCLYKCDPTLNIPGSCKEEINVKYCEPRLVDEHCARK